MKHLPPPNLLSAPVKVHVVGCGGSGSAIASGLPYLHGAMIARGHPHGLEVTLQDGDVVSETNCVRQPFSRSDLGQSKATILATRANLFWGLRWKAVPQHLKERDQLNADIVIGCVDSAAARRIIDRVCRRSGPSYWLDLGNGTEEGQFILGQPGHPYVSGEVRLPTAPELYPSILEDDERSLLPSCSALEALTRQAPFVNQVLANHALSLLARLFAGGIEHHGGFVNLVTGKASAIPVPEPPPPIPAPKPARKKSRMRVRVPA